MKRDSERDFSVFQEDCSRELEVALLLAREAGELILRYYQEDIIVDQKILRDNYTTPVTAADLAANKLIVLRLADLFPDDGILAEESVDTVNRLLKRRVWMIDPLDGTSGFIARDGDFAVQIGLAVDGKSILGVVYQPLADLMLWAVRGSGAWIKRGNSPAERARVSHQKEISRMGLAASRSHRSPKMDSVVRTLGVKEEVRRGSVGVKIGLIVERQCDLYIHLSPRTNQWDTCAPEVILEEAGGLLTDLFGQPLRYNVREVQNRNGVVASNGISHKMVIDKLAPLLESFGRQRV